LSGLQRIVENDAHVSEVIDAEQPDDTGAEAP
jgi:hypothetical protein